MAELRGLACVVFAGCMPYVIPPVTGDLGAARATGHSRTGLHADLGFAPFQLTRDQLDRSWDATISGSFDRINRNEYGGALAGGLVLHPWGYFTGDVTNRLLIQGVGRWTTEGFGAGTRVAIEHVKFIDGTTSSSNTSGASNDAVGFGETAIGLYAEAARWSFDGTPGWTFTAGLTLRVPVMAGIACCIH